MTAARSSRARCGRLALFVFVYVILLFHISGYVGNEMATTALSVSMAIVEEGTLTIDSYTAGARELAYRDGHFYSGMPPGQSLIAAPLYFVLQPVIAPAAELIAPRLAHIGAAREYHLHEEFAARRLLLIIAFTVLLAMPCAAATAVMVVDLSEAIGERAGTLGTLLLPLCTIWWSYGTEYGPRIMGGFLLLLPLWWVFVRRDHASDNQRLRMAGAIGLGLAMVPLIRYELIIPAAAIGLWGVVRFAPRPRIALLTGALLMGGLGMAYHYHCYGSPTNTSYTYKMWPESGLLPRHRAIADHLPRVEYEGEWWIVWDQEQLISFTPRVAARGLWDHPEALLRFSPFMALVPIGLVLLLRERSARELPAVLGALFALGIVVLAFMHQPGFRGAIGPRYVLWGLPPAVLLVLPAWNRLPRLIRGALFAVSFIPSYLAAMLGSHAQGAWSLRQLADFGLTNYTLSRAQLAGLFSPAISTAIVLAFWALIAMIFLRPGSGWYIISQHSADQAEQPEEG